MKIREIVSGQEAFPTIATDTTVAAAAAAMRDTDTRAVPVIEGDRLLGIVTDWDIVDAFAQEADALGSRPVSAIMTSENLVTVSADATVSDAARILSEHRVHHLPVLDGERYIGMVCLGLEWSEGGMLTPPVRPTLTARHP